MRSIPILCVVFGCSGSDGGETGEPAEESCGDVDGLGGDTGDVPDVLGAWTTTFGANVYHQTCSIPGLEQSAITWFGGPMEMTGWVPDGLRLAKTDDADDLRGLVAPTGGLSTSGSRETTWGTAYQSIGGLVLWDKSLDRPVWNGAVYIGFDEDGDGTIDCDVRADWRAIKSGS